MASSMEVQPSEAIAVQPLPPVLTEDQLIQQMAALPQPMVALPSIPIRPATRPNAVAVRSQPSKNSSRLVNPEPTCQSVTLAQAVPESAQAPAIANLQAQVPQSAQAPAIANLQAQISNLQSQISALQSQLSAIQNQLSTLQTPGAGSSLSTPYPPSPYAVPQPSQQPYAQQPLPGGSSMGAPLPSLPTAPTSQPILEPRSPATAGLQRPRIRDAAINQPFLKLQGAYIYQQDRSSARARVYGVKPLSRSVLVGGSIDLTEGNAFADSQTEGLSINELYVAIALPDVPNLRLLVGQLDLTSYFDRNSFAKDGATHFFNSTFQTNPALNAAGISSRQAALLNWSVSDNIEAKAAVFSSSREIANFTLDGFAGELALRYGNFILRGTYASDRDGGSRTGFNEIFQLRRDSGRFGLERGDREEAYGVNAEIFIPKPKIGLFGRYGRYTNRAVDLSGDTWMAGVSALDVFFKNDRIGIAYGQRLSNERLRRRGGDPYPDVLEVFYDFPVFDNIHLGFSYQGLDGFRESFFGVRVRADFDLFTPRRAVQ
jgi:hypothetical protein